MVICFHRPKNIRVQQTLDANGYSPSMGLLYSEAPANGYSRAAAHRSRALPLGLDQKT